MQRLNKVRLSGRAGEIVFSHEHYGRYYYKFMLTVIRKSGAVDMFPIVIEDSIVRDNDYKSSVKDFTNIRYPCSVARTTFSGTPPCGLSKPSVRISDG